MCRIVLLLHGGDRSKASIICKLNCRFDVQATAYIKAVSLNCFKFPAIKLDLICHALVIVFVATSAPN